MSICAASLAFSITPALGALARGDTPGALQGGSVFTVNDPADPGGPACTVSSCSPCRQDQRGIARPQGAHCDAGAFERLPHHIYLPQILYGEP